MTENRARAAASQRGGCPRCEPDGERGRPARQPRRHPPAPPRLERRPAPGVRRLLARAGHQRHPRRAGPPVPARRHLRLGERRARPARQGPAAAVPVVRARRDQEPEGDRRPRCPRHGGLPHLAGPRGPRPRLRHPHRGQGGAAPAPAGIRRLGTAPRRRRCLGGRLAGGPPAAERGGPRPRRGVPPPVGPLRRRRDRREQRLPRAARAGGRDRERGGMTDPAPGAQRPSRSPRRGPTAASAPTRTARSGTPGSTRPARSTGSPAPAAGWPSAAATPPR